MSEEVTRTSGGGSSMLTTDGSNSPARVDTTHCDKQVPRANDGIYGKCNYYYEPMMFGQIEAINSQWPKDSHPPSFPSQDGVDKSDITTGEVTDPVIDVSLHVSGIIGVMINHVWKRIPLERKDNETMWRRALEWHDVLIDPASNEGWSRYGNFWARHMNCGHTPPDYYTIYGYYYCSRYAVYLYPRLSAKGKKWMEDARYNLQVYLDKAIQDNMEPGESSLTVNKQDAKQYFEVNSFELELDNEIFKRVAFATHVDAYLDAYLDAGLGELDTSDLYAIGTMPNIEEWASWSTWEQALESGRAVATDKASRGLAEVQDWSEQALERLMSWF